MAHDDNDDAEENYDDDDGDVDDDDDQQSMEVHGNPRVAFLPHRRESLPWTAGR